MTRQVFSWLGIFVGIITIIIGLNIMDYNYGKSVSSVTFGADFYTEEHKATATAANNVKDLIEFLGKVFGWLFIGFGVFEICLFGTKLSTTMVTKKSDIVVKNEVPKI